MLWCACKVHFALLLFKKVINLHLFSCTFPFQTEQQTGNTNNVCLVYFGNVVNIHERSHGLKHIKCFRKTRYWFRLGFIIITTTTLPLLHATSTSHLTTHFFHTQHTTCCELLVYRCVCQSSHQSNALMAQQVISTCLEGPQTFMEL
jgi:hypothetical protein